VNIELPIDAIHTPGIEENQRHENVYRALLREPETQLKAANANLIQWFDQENAESEGTDEPDEQAQRD
jgi:hypothetical protein